MILLDRVGRKSTALAMVGHAHLVTALNHWRANGS